MAGLRGILAGLAISSAIIALPIEAQSPASVSLVHTVSVTVPPRVKVQVAKLAVSTPAAVRVSSSPINAEGLSLTVSANRAWVLAIGSDVRSATRKSRLQWSPDGRSQFSAVSTRDVAIASSDSSFDGKPANLFFRNAASAARSTGYGDAESVVLTVSAP
jgi:hypothetical protein